jgi:hypothetical protein
MRNGSGGHGAGRHEMRTSTPVRMTPTVAERLLDGVDGPADLRQLLDAAAGPGTASELAGEAVARAAFVNAPRTAPLPSEPSRTSVFSTALSKILAAKVLAAIVLVAGATGGVALAATSTRAPEAPPAAGPYATSGARPSAVADLGRPGGSDHPAAEQPGTHPIGTLEPAVAVLCHAWAAGAADEPGRAAENPAFAPLVAAAGGPGNVPTYCAGLAETADRSETSAPAQSGAGPGRSGTAPGQSGNGPGRSGSAPGHSGSAPGQSSTAPGHSAADHPGLPASGRPGPADGKENRPPEAHKPTEQRPDRSRGDIPDE